MAGVKASCLINEEKQYCIFDSREERLESLDKAIDRIRMNYGKGSMRSGDDISIREKLPLMATTGGLFGHITKCYNQLYNVNSQPI
jgi:hypothetical protein